MKKKTLEECFYQIRNGANIKQGVLDGGYPITRIETTSDGRFNREKMGYAGITDLSKYESYVLEDGDLLMSHINSVQYLGRTVLYKKKDTEEKIIHGMNLLSLKANKDVIKPEYARYYFCSSSFKKQITRIAKKSVNQASFTVADLKKLVVDVPPLSEQMKIAEILDCVNEVIFTRRQELQKLDDLVKARFVEMFGDVVNSPKYSGIPLGDICSTLSGGTPTTKVPAYYQGNIPWISTPYLGNSRINGSSAKAYITEEAINNSSTHLIPANTIMFGIRVGVGKSSIIDEPMCANQDIVALMGIDTGKYNLLFIKHTLDGYQSHFDSIKKGATILGITTEDLKNVLVPNVDIDLQNQFATFAEQTDKSKAAIQKSLDKLQTLFDKLMQEYFG